MFDNLSSCYLEALAEEFRDIRQFVNSSIRERKSLANPNNQYVNVPSCGKYKKTPAGFTFFKLKLQSCSAIYMWPQSTT